MEEVGKERGCSAATRQTSVYLGSPGGEEGFEACTGKWPRYPTAVHGRPILMIGRRQREAEVCHAGPGEDAHPVSTVIAGPARND